MTISSPQFHLILMYLLWHFNLLYIEIVNHMFSSYSVIKMLDGHKDFIVMEKKNSFQSISPKLCLSLWLWWKGRGMSYSDSLMAPPSQLTVCAAGNRHKKCGVKWEERKKQTDWVREQQVGWHNGHCSKTAAPQKQRVTFMWSHTTGAQNVVVRCLLFLIHIHAHGYLCSKDFIF